MAKDKVELVHESMNDSIYRYNSPINTDAYIGSDIEQSTAKLTGHLKYNLISKSDDGTEEEGYVYEVGYNAYWRCQVVYKYPFLFKRGLEEESPPKGMRVVEWY